MADRNRRRNESEDAPPAPAPAQESAIEKPAKPPVVIPAERGIGGRFRIDENGNRVKVE